MQLFKILESRYSSYQLNKTSTHTDEAIYDIITTTTQLTPSTFNGQSQRVVTLFGDANETFWDITLECIKDVAPQEVISDTIRKIDGLRGQGTVLFYIDIPTVLDLQQQKPIYHDEFPVWADQENAMLQVNIWLALTEANLGASLHHYNPIIDARIQEAFDIDPSWTLVAQLAFGEPRDTKQIHDTLPIETRVSMRK